MFTYNYKITNEDIYSKIDFKLFKDKANILIQVFCGKSKEELQKTLNILSQELKQAQIISLSSNGEIIENEIMDSSINISISVFENTNIKAISSQDSCSYSRGLHIAQELVKEETKLLILFTDPITTNSEELIEAIEKHNHKVIICGGLACKKEGLEKSFIAINNKIIDIGTVAVALNSKTLEVSNDYRFNWSQIGIEHKITEVKNNNIYSINNTPVIEFYKKYLGDDIENNLIDKTISFPLILNKKEIDIARAVTNINKDGSLSYTGPFKENDKVKFGFGNAKKILNEDIIPKTKDYSNTESFFIFSCSARKEYLEDYIRVENEAYASIAPTIGCFTFGEFYHNKNKNYLLNHSFTVVSLSENIQKKKNKKQIQKKKSLHNTNMEILSNLIEQSSIDYNKQSKSLEAEKINSQILLTSQKIFLKHAVHETNTPLSVIMSNIELYEMEHGKNQYLSTIEVALKNIFNIYDDLSFLVNNDQIEYPKKNIDFIDFIRSRIDFFTQAANQISSQFIFHCDTNRYNLHFNETKLQRIIDNNLTNAIKYTEENSNIYITLKQEVNMYVLVISSCSQYIQYPEKIFKEYYREEATKRGFGLGLSLVKRICDEENVNIIVESNEYFTSFVYQFKLES